MSLPANLVARTVRIALVNPNTSMAATEVMLASARAVLPGNVEVQGFTATEGQELISDETALQSAARMMVQFALRLATPDIDAMIVCGFGDPGLAEIDQCLRIPVTGLAQASLSEAAAGGRRFSIVTVTPALDSSLRAAALLHGRAGHLASIRYTDGLLSEVMRTPASLQQALLLGCQRAVQEDGAEAIVIGGGPLAQAAGWIAARLNLPVIDPVAAAVRLTCHRCVATASK